MKDRKAIIYFRESITPKAEVEAAQNHFRTTFDPIVESGWLVIPRYSLYPFPKDLERHVRLQGASLIQTYGEHEYIAQSRYVNDIEALTPKTWFSLERFMADEQAKPPYVLKGVTYSKRNQFSTHMFAQTKADVVQVYSRLQNDGLVGQDPIIIKEFHEFQKLLDPVADEPPVINEYRVFVLDGQLVSAGFYWSNYMQDILDAGILTQERFDEYTVRASNFALQVAARLQATFVAIDVAFDRFGVPWVVEVNDGCQAGLSTIPVDDFYADMSKVVDKSGFVV